MGETDFKDFLFIKLVGELHEYKDVVVLCFGYHILFQDFDERLHFQELDYGIVLNEFTSGNLDRETVETF